MHVPLFYKKIYSIYFNFLYSCVANIQRIIIMIIIIKMNKNDIFIVGRKEKREFHFQFLLSDIRQAARKIENLLLKLL